MGKQYEEKREIKKSLASITCDFCGNKQEAYQSVRDERVDYKQEGMGNPEHAAVNDGHVEFERRVSFSDRYEGHGTAKTYTFDMCAFCWVTKFVPWAKTQGAVPEITESDY